MSANDYPPGGMLQPNRTYSASNSYRHGFNGKENDNEVKGEGNQQDYGMRIYDPRIARFLSVDPISDMYPWNSPYSFAEGDPVNFIDLDGLERCLPPPPGRVIPRSSGYSGQGARTPGGQAGQQAGITLAQASARVNLRRQEAENARERSLPSQQRAQNSNFRSNINNYLLNVFTSARYTFAGPNAGGLNVSINRTNGSLFEKEVATSMLKSGNYSKVVSQVTFSIESTSGTIVKIRIDNVGLTKDGKLDLVEAKFSILGTVKGGIWRSFTPNQHDAVTMAINGEIASIKILGTTKPMELGLKAGDNVTGIIKDIKVAVPIVNQNPSNNTNSNPSKSTQKTDNN